MVELKGGGEGTHGVHQKVVIEHHAKFQLCPIFFQQMAILKLIFLDYTIVFRPWFLSNSTLTRKQTHSKYEEGTQQRLYAHFTYHWMAERLYCDNSQQIANHSQSHCINESPIQHITIMPTQLACVAINNGREEFTHSSRLHSPPKPLLYSRFYGRLFHLFLQITLSILLQSRKNGFFQS